MRRTWMGLFAGVVLAAAGALDAQVVTDRQLSRVNGDVIMESDVRQAKLLKLVSASATTDDAILVELENRRLVLAEVARAAPAEPTADEVASRRRQWESALGGSATALLAQAGMSEASLTSWLRDDVRMDRYLTRRFAAAPNPAAEIDQWIKSLRKRAGLKIGGAPDPAH